MKPGAVGSPCLGLTKQCCRKPVCCAGRGSPCFGGCNFGRSGCRFQVVRRPGRPCVPDHRVCTQASSSPEWHKTAAAFAEGCLQQLRDLTALLAQVWEDRMLHLQTWYSKTLVACICILLALTALANLWGVPSINNHLLPQATQTACAVLDREVTLGKVNWIAPTGVVGLTPLASLGPVEVGPSPVESSSAVLPEVLLRLDPLQSLIHRKLMLQLQADSSQVALVQNDNFSWFGYPDDTLPSTRNFLPGLQKVLNKEKEALLDPEAADAAPVRDPQAAKLAEKEERRKHYAVPPEAAANFRPAVGKELVEHALKHSAAKKSQSQEVQYLAKSDAKRQSAGYAQALQADRASEENGSETAEQQRAVQPEQLHAASGEDAASMPAAEATSKSQAEPNEAAGARTALQASATDADPAEGTDTMRERDQSDENSKPPDEVRAKAEEPVTLDLAAGAKQGAAGLLSQHAAAAAAALPGEGAPLPSEVQRLAASEPHLGLAAADTLSEAVKDATASPDATASVAPQAVGQVEPGDGLIAVQGTPAHAAFASLSVAQLGYGDSFPQASNAVELLPELRDAMSYEAVGQVAGPGQGPAAQLLKTEEAGSQPASVHASLEFLQDQARDQQAEKVQPQPAGLQNSQLMFAQEAVPSLLGQPGPVSSSQGSVQDVTRAAALKTTLVPDKAAEGQCIQQSDAGPDSEKHLAAQERIQQSKEASTSGRSAQRQPVWVMRDRVRTHGGYRSGDFARPAVRRTARSYMRRDMPLSEQVQPQRSRGAALQQAQGAGVAAQAPETSKSTFDIQQMQTGEESPLLLLTGDTAGTGNRTRSSAESAKELSGQQQAEEELPLHSPVVAGSAEGGQVAASADASDSMHSEIVRGPAAQRDNVGRTRSRKRRRAASQPQFQMSARDLGPDDTGSQAAVLAASNGKGPYARPPVRPLVIGGDAEGHAQPSWLHRSTEQARKLARSIHSQAQRGSSRTDAAQEVLLRQQQANTPAMVQPQLPNMRWPLKLMPVLRQHKEPEKAPSSVQQQEPVSEHLVGPGAERAAGPPLEEGNNKRSDVKRRWGNLRDARRLIRPRQDAAAIRASEAGMRASAASSRTSSKMAFAFLPEQSAKVFDSAAAAAAGCSQTAMATSFSDNFTAATDDAVFKSMAVDSLSQQHQSSSFPEPSQKHSNLTPEENAEAAEQVAPQLPQPADSVRQSEVVVPQDDRPVTGDQVVVALSAPSLEGPHSVVGTLTFDSSSPSEPSLEAQTAPEASSSAAGPSVTEEAAKAEQPSSPRPGRPSSAEPRLSKPKQRATASKRPRPSEEDTGPRYKPGAQAPTGSRSGVGGWLSQQLGVLARDIRLPQVGVESIRIWGGELKASLVGESVPRRISDVNLVVRLSNDYRNLMLDVTGNAHERDAASNRCTMTSAAPVRHLRDAPRAPITRLPTDVPVPAGSCSEAGSSGDQISFKLGVSMKELRDSFDHLAADAKAKVGRSGGSSSEVQPDQAGELPELKQAKRHWWGGRKIAAPEPTGGRIRVKVNSKGLHLRYPDTHIQLWSRNLHAPMAERILEIPIDVYNGRFAGEFKMHAYDARTWQLPLFSGRVRCRDMAFHFWDATDDFARADMDLLFEGHRLYLHDARGFFGAVPMTMTGDMDLDPVTGQYRLSASVPAVEVNDLRKTLGIRPPPFAVGGALRGVLHCTGPLEQPVFSGTAVALPPSQEAVQAMEASNAKDTLQMEPEAAGAYDRVPFASASAIFTMDTSNDIFLLHSIQAEPLDGGQLLGAGRMWVNPIAEHDPQAVKVHMEGHGLPFEPILLRYMPKGMHLPPSLVLGEGNVQGTMQGSHMAPDISSRWDLPAASASGTADFSRDLTKVTCKAPAIDISGALHVVPPDFDAVKKATTQAEVSALAAMVLDGLDLDADFKGLDVLPILSPPEALEHINSSQPMRLKLNGRVKFSGGIDHSDEKSSFVGDLSLDNLRVNQLKLTRNLTGNLSVAEDSFQVQAKGSRLDEALDVTLKLPLLDPGPAADAARAAKAAPSAETGSGPFGIKLGDLLPLPGFGGSAERSNPAEAAQDGGGGHFSLRCGQLLMSAEVNGRASVVDCQVQGLKLDELELASLRGEVQEASLRLDLEARQGRGQVAVQGPRFSGLQGESLSTAVRWERDVVRLERANLQQKSSRYEVQGEYVIPANVAIPRSAASMALVTRDSDAPQNWSPFESSSGRWRVQVNVPTAQMEEILPAARLLSRATSPTPSDYERAKSAFLRGVHEAAIQAQELGRQLEAASESARAQISSSLASDEETGPGGRSSPGSRAALPGLQDLKGQWNGTFQAYGGGGGASNVDFNMRGQDWTWGDYSLAQAVAQGSCHSLEGVKLEEVSLRTGDAKLLVRGKLLTADQNASILLTDFPVAMLQPLFRSMPALEHAAPAVGSGASGGGNNSFSGLTMPFRGADRTEAAARPASSPSFSNSPVTGLLYIRGIIGGSATVPEGELVVRLFDGAIGPTQLAQAQATASLDAAQRLSFSMDFAPAEPRSGGFARVTGSLPLRPAPTSTMLVTTGSAAVEEPPALGDSVEVGMRVKDGGMKLVGILTPDFRWQSGNADIELRLHGRPGALALDGGLHASKATITSPFLKYPMSNVAASVTLADNVVQVENVEAKVGRRGFFRARGDLPIAQPDGGQHGLEPRGSQERWNAIVMDVHDLELRLRNMYTGYLDASMQVRNSLAQPVLGGDVRLSRGTAVLAPQGGLEVERAPPGQKEDDLVQKAFTVLSRKEGLAKQLAKPQGDVAGESQGMPSVQLRGLQVRLGPELRAMYPVVVNLGISGDVELNGAADPSQLRMTGVVNLESGEINLVAAQLVLDREHNNRLVFDGQEGLDPVVDLSLRGAQIRALIQGRASTWHRHLILTPITAPVGEAAEQLQPSEAARIFEGQLASALVAEDGQLALSNLAVSAAHGFMPKIQTQGQLGQARWRLVSAPSIPGLLSLDPTGDPTSLLSSLTMGTEVEVQFGNSLQAAMARKLRDSDIATQWTLNYQLNSKLRMQFTIASVHPYPRTLLFQYSGDSS